MLEDGSLLRRTNHAVAAYGHGALRHGDETLHIGGSTGAVSRFTCIAEGQLLRGRLGAAVLLSLR